MTTLRKHLRHQYLKAIISGEKTCEGRLASKITQWNLNIGTKITFYSTENDRENNPTIDEVETTVIGLDLYEDFGHAFDELGEHLLPGITSRNDAIRLYNYFAPLRLLRRLCESLFTLTNAV